MVKLRKFFLKRNTTFDAIEINRGSNMPYFKKSSIVCLGFSLILGCSSSTPNATPSASPKPGASAAPASSPNPAASASAPGNVSFALPEQLTDAIRLYECYISRTSDQDKKAYLKSNLNVMKNYTQDRWALVRRNDPDGLNTKEFGEARMLGCQ